MLQSGVIEVLEYFREHPDAADTLEGIARWRLLQRAITKTVRETNEAIRWLVAEGFLLERTSPATAPLFRLNPARRREAVALLRHKSRSGKPSSG
ncbi:MAG TPA: hypothetical protein VFU76_16735 [Terriglobales bacterium]|nr:hypothetical protein [Terriglobales bacterium]